MVLDMTMVYSNRPSRMVTKSRYPISGSPMETHGKLKDKTSPTKSDSTAQSPITKMAPPREQTGKTASK